MRWLIWPRQYGKSYRVCEWFLENPEKRVIVTENEQMARVRRNDLEWQWVHAQKDRWPDPREYTAAYRKLMKLLKSNVMSYRSWANGQRGMAGMEVALDGCVQDILRKFVGVAGDLKIISDAGRVEEPDPNVASQAQQQHDYMKEKFSNLFEAGWDPGVC